MLFELMMKPVDSFWKRRWKETEKLRRHFEADASCERGFRESAEKELDKLHDTAWKQSVAIRTMQDKINTLTREIDRLERDLAVKTREAELLSQLVKALQEGQSDG